MSNYQKTIAIDFDGVIHRYSRGWHDGTIYDKPMEGAVDAILRLMKRGYRIVIFTCRAETEDGRRDVLKWLDKHFDWERTVGHFYEPEVTNVKPKAIAYIDDRGLRFTNWKDMLNYF
jgi:ribonucleotide monophosphatase NagD (HAD superfamily)